MLILFENAQVRRCAPGGIRTPDRRIRSPMLYPAELRAPGAVLSVERGWRPRTTVYARCGATRPDQGMIEVSLPIESTPRRSAGRPRRPDRCCAVRHDGGALLGPDSYEIGHLGGV